MVEPRTAAEGNYMLERMMEIYPLVPPNLWIGLSDQQEEGVFRWLSDNSTLTQEFWIAGQPDNGGYCQGVPRIVSTWSLQPWDTGTMLTAGIFSPKHGHVRGQLQNKDLKSSSD